MITYKTINLKSKISPELFTQVNEYLKSKNTYLPDTTEMLFLAYDDTFKLIGVCAIKRITQIEPLVVDDGFPRVTQILGEKAMSVASLMDKSVIAMVSESRVEYISQLEKYGFVTTDKSMTILRKEV